jgi:DNA-binding NtrC family response regulator
MQDCRKILIVDDEPNAIRVLSVILKEEGYHVLESLNVDNAIATIQNEDVDAIITDLKMPARTAQLFKYVSEHHPDIPVVFLTAYGTVESAVNAMQGGAYYYFIKPPDYPKLKNVLARALDQYSLKKEFETLKKRTSRENNIYPIIGKAPSMAGIVKTIGRSRTRTAASSSRVRPARARK